jgi:4-hydroxyacetophenone monooxygenase
VNSDSPMVALDPSRLREALVEADVPVLLMVLMHLTGDRKWIETPFRPQREGRLFADESGGLQDAVQTEVREAAYRALTGGPLETKTVSPGLIQAMLSVFVGEEVPAEYVPLAMEELGVSERAAILPTEHRRIRATVIGAGVAGLAMAISLAELGVDFVVLEKNSSVGGTWFENRYPEAGVDTPNHFYSYSFAPNLEWTRYFSKAEEIHAYLKACAARYGVLGRVQLDATASVAHYDETAQTWTVEFVDADGNRRSIVSEILITAVGQVNRPKIPQIDGLDRFRGPAFHTARWPHGLNLADKRVAIVGTGASAVQIARTVAQASAGLTIYQRSPQWIMPNPDYHRTVSRNKTWLLQNVPFYSQWYRFGLFWRYADGVHAALRVDPSWPHQERSVNATNDRHRGFLTRHMDGQLRDRPDLLEKALPDYPPYGKRMVVDNDWFKTLKRENVELVTSAVTEITVQGVIAGDGIERPADVLVFATGFDATRMIWPLEITGRDGVSIHDHWKEDEPRTNLGITTDRFPNLFMLFGPTTSLAHGGSAIFQIEAQVRYIAQCLSMMARMRVGSLEARGDAVAAYTNRADDAHRHLVFSHKGMNNWYKNRSGRVVTVSPWRLVDYWHMTRTPDFDDFHARPSRQGLRKRLARSRDA